MDMKENITISGEFRVPKIVDENGIKKEDLVSVGYASVTLQLNNMSINTDTRIFDKELALSNIDLIKQQYDEFQEVIKKKGLNLGLIFF